MNYAVITSMNKSYFDHCGNLMIESYKKYWTNIRMYLYNEDFNIKARGISCQGWNLGEEYQKFQNRWASNRKIQTFAKKGFSIIHAMENIECDRLIWIDADTILKREINLQLLELISPDNVLSTHFGVEHLWPSETDPNRTMFSCETGFFILNKKHPEFENFKNIYKDIYVNDKNGNLRRFYDGEVYGETVRILSQQGTEFLNLNPDNRHKTPIPRSLLDPYLSHYKAGSKDNIDFTSLITENEI